MTPAGIPTDAATILPVERAFIGGALSDHGRTIPKLHVAEFYLDRHQIIWAALLNLVETSGQVGQDGRAHGLCCRRADAHMVKDSDRKALYRAMGSIAFVGVARSVLCAVDPDDPANDLEAVS